jgi:hypothetical protein
VRISKTKALLNPYVLLIGCCAGCNPFAIDARAAPFPPPAGTHAVAPAGAGMNAGSAGRTATATSAATGSKPAGMAMVTTPPIASGQPSAQTPAMSASPAASSAGTSAETSGQSASDPSAAAGGTGEPASTTPSTPTEGTAAGGANAGAPPATGRTARSTVTTATLEPGGLECPHEICKGLPEADPQAAAMGFSLALCCTPEGWCGTGQTDKPCVLTPDSEPQCEELMLMGYIIASCCTSDGKCGINGKSLMMADCSSNEDVAASQFGSFITPPAPSTCTPGLTAPVADPGTSTAGASAAPSAGASAANPSAGGTTAAAPAAAGTAAP